MRPPTTTTATTTTTTLGYKVVFDLLVMALDLLAVALDLPSALPFCVFYIYLWWFLICLYFVQQFRTFFVFATWWFLIYHVVALDLPEGSRAQIDQEPPQVDQKTPHQKRQVTKHHIRCVVVRQGGVGAKQEGRKTW